MLVTGRLSLTAMNGCAFEPDAGISLKLRNLLTLTSFRDRNRFVAHEDLPQVQGTNHG